MGKQDYLDALAKAMAGLPPETAARTLAYYEQRFIDGLTVGRSEAEIAAELDEPRKIAMTLRANAHLAALEPRKAPAGFARAAFTFVGLAVFNLFMVVPAAVCAALLMALYFSSAGFYVSGIAITSSGLAGANEIVLSGPLHNIVGVTTDNDDERHAQTRISIGEDGIHVEEEALGEQSRATTRSGRIFDGAEAMADGSVRIEIDREGSSRAAQTTLGTGLIVGGIALFLLSLVLTRYAALGLKRYVQMNYALLQGR
ncbi:DUF1700 domain-containing protein [Pseudoduganella plicata]|uniref:DUF1700 domain-containing protein n=1 Tax=Pseudoduganella plicata TaxID=321984 RepID=A0A4P7B9R6_9BURK|nr:DUF1700 domain-containing protein [Pseudoduganella plicata]QBQ35286.1 DUF1700 domain-containing protein [Pseudoduganella plicata]GGZ00553.1 hypothetical protein GCM10007388_37560 [Pseudoduganella plicata]